MKFNKKIAVLAAAGALSIAAAVPAMAFENEFHGSYFLKYTLSNYEAGGGGYIATSTTQEKLKTNNYFDQRARLFYTAKASDDLKMVTGFEIDYNWGDNNMYTGRNHGGGMEADSVNLETKHVYLDFKIPSTPTNVKLGMHAIKDGLKGILFDCDAPGITTSTKLGNATMNLAYYRGYDQALTIGGNYTGTTKGMNNLDMGTVEFLYNLTKDTKLGMVYYIYGDGRNVTYSSALTAASTQLHTLGLTGETKLGKLELSGFAAYQHGLFKGVGGTAASLSGGTINSNAIAANVAAKYAVGPGSLHTAFLFASGNNDADKKGHSTGWVSYASDKLAALQSDTGKANTWGANGGGVSTYYEGQMMLLSRNPADKPSTTDYALIYGTSNGDTPYNAQGQYQLTMGYDATITPKLFAKANLGFAWAQKNNSLKKTDTVTGKKNASNFQGTEINIETGYKVYDNLTARIQAAYLMLGGYYAKSVAGGKDPENPYTARVIMQYAF